MLSCLQYVIQILCNKILSSVSVESVIKIAYESVNFG